MSEPPSRPLAAWFLGPRAENARLWDELIAYIFQDYIHWRRNYFPTDPVVVDRVRRRSSEHESWVDGLTAHLDFILNELKHHFPFHSPRYIAHMLSEQSLPSFLGYFAGLLFNPNNVTDEAAPITVALELEVGKMIADMLGYNPKRSWAHICSGGTAANLEALWVARSVQFVPFVVREYCQEHKLGFTVKAADGTDSPVEALTDRQLIGLRPNESIFMLRKLAHFIHRQSQMPLPDVLDSINNHFLNSRFNVARRGVYSVLESVGMKPVIFVSAAAHYSISKTANVLGYGEEAVRLVPVNQRFQVNLDTLKGMLFDLSPDEYVAAVVGIVGTTEEGAVDAIHRIRFLRDDLEREKNRSFWFHVDAAWGGYIRSLFKGLKVERSPHGRPLGEICDDYVRAIQAEERFIIDFGIEKKKEKTMTIRWSEREIYASFLAMADADSTTIDPHKMGFVPYPAGVVAFRNGLVTELIVQRAQYISDVTGGLKGIDQPASIDAVGPFVLEGSKPGAVAIACWLAHKTIPLEADGHGKIIRTTLLNAKKLFKYIVNHRYLFKKIHTSVTGEEHCIHPFTFVPFFEPDTNVICFIARPMGWQGGQLVDIDFSLQWTNFLNEKIYAAASIPLQRRKAGPFSQPFFVSRTRFDHKQYSGASLSEVLHRIGIDRKEYEAQGVFVLRSVVMNPWYFSAEQVRMNYLYEFVKFLHKVTHTALEETYKAMSRTVKKI